MTMTAKNKKEALLQAAKELFGECGYVETTFKKISDRAGVALGLLTHHYGNKEKLFLASGLDVLEHFLVKLRQATADAACGYDAVMHFCKAYLDFSVDKDSNWLVLVRCSPYSDMKTKTDREQMDSMFAQVHRELEEQIQRGIRDGSIVNVDSKATAQVIISLMVGANRTRVLTPYALPELYDETLDFVSRSIRKNSSFPSPLNNRSPAGNCRGFFMARPQGILLIKRKRPSSPYQPKILPFVRRSISMASRPAFCRLSTQSAFRKPCLHI